MSIRSKRMIAVALFVFLATALLAIGASVIKPSPYRLEDRVSSDLQLLKLVLEKYRDENGQYPSISEGLKVLASRGYVSSPRFDVDAWGSNLIYTVEGSVTRLYSPGRNRTDEGGGGDDIAVVL